MVRRLRFTLIDLGFKFTYPLNFLEEHARVLHEAETILDIPSSSTLPEDSVIWNATPNGKFLVRSAYKLAMDKLREAVALMMEH